MHLAAPLKARGGASSARRAPGVDTGADLRRAALNPTPNTRNATANALTTTGYVQHPLDFGLGSAAIYRPSEPAPPWLPGAARP